MTSGNYLEIIRDIQMRSKFIEEAVNFILNKTVNGININFDLNSTKM